MEKTGDAATYLFGRKYYDYFLSEKCRSIHGTQSVSPRRAVYLIYPSEGLLPSHLRSLRYLDAKGICTTIVSNLPLSQAEEDALKPLCHRYIQRPNFGYDFGGYRDGVLSLVEGLSGMEQLILLNDSAWFPISDKTDWLDDVDKLEVNFGAAASNYGLPRPEPAAFREMVFDYRTDHQNFHYTSYALSFDRDIISHPDFVEFWQNFPLTNKKRRVVRRGEIGLTAWVIKQGFTHGETLGVQHIEGELDTLDEARLREIARSTMVPEDSQMQRVKSELKNTMDTLTRAELISFILTTVARQGASYALASFNVFERDFPFLKKSPVWLNRESSDITLNILDQLNTPAAAEARAEADVLRARLKAR